MMKGQKAAIFSVFFLILPGILTVELLQDNFLTPQLELLGGQPDAQRTNNFKFRSRKVGDKMITVVSLKMDPERGRRSILVPDGEGLLHPASFAHLRHPHRFIPPFDDVDQIPLNKSISWGGHRGPRLTSVEELEAIEEKTNKVLEEIETSLTNIEETLNEENRRKKTKKNKNKNNSQENSKRKKAKDDQREANSQEGSRRRKGKDGKKEANSQEGSRRRNSKEEKKEAQQNAKERRRKQEGKADTKKGKKESAEKTGDKSRKKMVGDEACQYKMLRKCAKKLGLLPRKSVEVFSDFQRCSHRKRFLECVEKRREKQSCKARTVARGNLSGLRTWIKKSFWTANSCLLNEALKGR